MESADEKAGTLPRAYRPNQSRTASFRSATRRLSDRRYTRGILVVLTLLVIWFYAPAKYTERGYLACRHLPGAQDSLVIMKTGVTELEDRLPAHLDYTLQCPPNTVIFSDHEEMYQGKWQIRDVLANMDRLLRAQRYSCYAQQRLDNTKEWCTAVIECRQF